MRSPVSVLIPAYNCEAFLAETLDSVLAQSYPAAEIIVMDDGSVDRTRSVVAKYGDRVKYHCTENGGICRARNTAASLASSPYLAFCDHDDLWREDKLALQMALHEAHPELDYSFTNFRLVVDGVWDATTKFDRAPQNLFPPSFYGTESFLHDDSLYERILVYQPIMPSTIVLKRSFFDKLGGFREELGKNPAEDIEFTLRCVAQGRIGILPAPVVGIRRHDGNFSKNLEANARGEIEVMRYALQNHPISDSTRSVLRREIEVRHVELSYGAFRRGEFGEVVTRLSNLSSVSLDPKSRLKLWIARLPNPLAKAAQSLLLH